MELSDIQFCFNRALSSTFSKKKLCAVSLILLLCGLLVVFFRGLALHTGKWVALSLTFLPVFICAGILLATGVILVRIYHDEVKKKKISYRAIVSHSWDIVIGTAYLCIPIILGYLLLWMMLGIFFLLNDIPLIGHFFGVILAFAPFLLNVGALTLCLISLSMLFLVVPAVALKGLSRVQLSQLVAKRFQSDTFFNCLLAAIASFPLLCLFGLLTLAAIITESICYTCENPLYITMQSFFIMIPFMMLLSPAVVFFFNFAAEAHVLLQKQVISSR